MNPSYEFGKAIGYILIGLLGIGVLIIGLRRKGGPQTMNGVPLVAYLGLGMFMFTAGVVGVIIRRNPIVIFMCIELMLNGVNLTFLAFARYMPVKSVTGAAALHNANMSGQMMVIFVMAVAAAEVAVGLGIIMAIFRLRNNVDIDEMNLLRG